MKIQALVLLFVFTATAFAKMHVIVNYVTQYERYVNELCENKDKPELACNGSCAFMKEMGLTEDSQPEKPVLPESEVHISAFTITDLPNPIFAVEFSTSACSELKIPSIMTAHSIDLLRPPQV